MNINTEEVSVPGTPTVILIPSSRFGSTNRSQGLTVSKPLAAAACYSLPQLPSPALQGSTANSSASSPSLLGHFGISSPSSLASSFKRVVPKFQETRVALSHQKWRGCHVNIFIHLINISWALAMFQDLCWGLGNTVVYKTHCTSDNKKVCWTFIRIAFGS